MKYRVRARQVGKAYEVIMQLQKHIDNLNHELCYYQQRYNRSLKENAKYVQLTQEVGKANDNEIRAYREVLRQIANFPHVPFLSIAVMKHKAKKVLDSYLPR